MQRCHGVQHVQRVPNMRLNPCKHVIICTQIQCVQRFVFGKSAEEDCGSPGIDVVVPQEQNLQRAILRQHRRNVADV